MPTRKLDKNPLWWLYNMGLTLGWPWLGLYYELRARSDGKYARSRKARLGLEPPKTSTGTSTIWCHALSVGESLSALPLVKALRRAHPRTEIHFSTATEAGFQIAGQRLSPWVDQVFFLCHDFLWSTHRTLRAIRPDLFVLIETDLWPNLLWNLAQKRVPLMLVNGRLSKKSFQHYRRLLPLVRPMMETFDLIFAQSRQDARYYRRLGAPAERVDCLGNLKFDLAIDEKVCGDPSDFKQSVGISPERPVWIAGSTHPGEEEILLSVHAELLETFPDLLFIPAPRQPGRAAEILSLCRNLGLPCTCRSRGPAESRFSVFVLDTLGELATFYSISDAAFIGGSLVPFGGHNPLEAVVYGQPVCWGPYLTNFREVEKALEQEGCGHRVNDSKELQEALHRWLRRSESGREAALRVRQFLERGCVAERIVNRITDLLERSSNRGAALRIS